MKSELVIEFLPAYSTMNVGKYSHRCPAFEGMINMASKRNNFERGIRLAVMRLAVMLLRKLAMTNFTSRSIILSWPHQSQKGKAQL